MFYKQDRFPIYYYNCVAFLIFAAMASPCWKCRAHVLLVMQVYDFTPAGPCPICMDEEDPQVCVAAPCGHHICGTCARLWASQLTARIPVPAAPVVRVPVPAAAEAVEEAVADPGPATPALQPAEVAEEAAAEQAAPMLGDD